MRSAPNTSPVMISDRMACQAGTTSDESAGPTASSAMCSGVSGGSI
jgi:hypothetical protein